MKLSYNFHEHEVETIKRIVAYKLASGRRFVQHRLQHNVTGSVPEVNDETLWKAHIMCLLTTQQRSGPDSPGSIFLAQQPFPLSLESCRSYADLENTAFNLLTDMKGIRRTNKIAKAIHSNLLQLEQGEWDNLRKWRDTLMVQRANAPDPAHQATEELAADYMDRFLEFGPKQSRNFWQFLGLTRYTFVLDSRILKWLRENLDIEVGFLTSSGLGDKEYYCFISNILLDLCNQADVLPCMLDVAIFDTFDEGSEWSLQAIS